MASEPDKPEALYVVSDCVGFVGAFPSAAAAEVAVIRAYPTIPFIVQRFPVAPGPCDTVWVVLFRDIDAVAFVSNSREGAEKVKHTYDRVGLTYDDSIDYWEQAFGVVSKPAAERLQTQLRAHTMYAGQMTAEEYQRLEEEDMARLDAITQPRADGPLARLIRENELVTILDCVVPVDAALSAAEDTPNALPEDGAAS